MTTIKDAEEALRRMVGVANRSHDCALTRDHIAAWGAWPYVRKEFNIVGDINS